MLEPDENALHTTPKFRSIVAILLFAPAFNSLLVMIFSTARTTPSLHRMPTHVPPFSTALTAYSTLKRTLASKLYYRMTFHAYLEIPAVWGEYRVLEVVPSTNGCLSGVSLSSIVGLCKSLPWRRRRKVRKSFGNKTCGQQRVVELSGAQVGIPMAR